MSSSSRAGEPPSSPTDANAPAVAMDAKLMVARGSGDVQQLKDLVNKEDSEMVVVVMASSKQAASTAKPRSADMDPHLLALAFSGSYKELEYLLNEEDHQDPNSTNGALVTHRATGDIEAKKSLLDGATAEGDTALHVVASYGQGDAFLPMYERAKRLLDRNKKRRTMILYRGQCLAEASYGDSDKFLETALVIYVKANHLLFQQNKNGDTPLHCAARAGKSKMVSFLIDLAKGEDDRVKELLRKENMHKETALHEAVRIGNKDIVKLFMDEDSELASFPEEGASPLYIAILLNHNAVVDMLYNKSGGQLSYSGQNGQNALHAAVLRPGLTKKLLKWNEDYLLRQNKDLTMQKDKNGSTPLHFAASLKYVFGTPSACRQVLQANADATYQPDHGGLFPIHVAASVGAVWTVDLIVKKCPGSAGLRDAKGRTFLHVAAEKKKEDIIEYACRKKRLSWIMNVPDNDGNTALHLAVEIGSLRIFCPLLGHRQVNLNLPNKNGETPLDIAESKIPERGLYYLQSSEAQIARELRAAGAKKGIRRLDDHFEETKERVNNKSKKMEVLKDSTGSLCVGSVLITSVTFGATFAVPGGYIADDHNNGGTPIFARRYAFDAFMVSNTLAFVFSAIATVALMRSGSPTYNLQSRISHYNIASYSLAISVKSLAAAFALGAYVVLAPVAHKTAIAICIPSSLVVLCGHAEFIWRRLLLLPAICKRHGLIWALLQFVLIIVGNFLIDYWPLIAIFGWAAYASPAE